MLDATAPPTPSAPAPAEIARFFPAYQIEGLVACGGMGAVYKARQVSLDRDVAIKLLPREFGNDAAFRQSFVAEAKAMARLNHPNLISVYDFGEADGLLYIVMEFVPGKSLFHSAHGIAIDPCEAGRLIASVCDGLAHAHEHGILHRDIKPANILLTPKAEPKIGDFGLARPLGSQHAPGETVFGTPSYAAPEVLSHPDRVDPRADIFSVGVVLHELLTGNLPADDPRAPSRIAGCDPRFDTIVRRATHPSPEMRYPDAATMARELRELLDALAGPKFKNVATTLRRGLPSSHTTTSLRPSPVVPRASSAAPWLVLAVIAAAGILAFVMFQQGSKPPPAGQSPTTGGQPQTPPPAPPASPRPPEPAPDTTADSSVPQPIPTPEPVPEPAPNTHDTSPPPPTPTPEPPPAPPPFDTASWLENARGIMRDKASPTLREQEASLERNVNAFQRDVNRVLRRLDDDLGDPLEEKSDDLFDKFREQGNRIAPKLDLAFDKIEVGWGRNREERRQSVEVLARAIPAHHAAALKKQAAIDQKFEADMLALSRTYVFGLEKQVDRLRQSVGQEVAVADLTTEATATKERPARFIRMMQGLDPDPPPEPPTEAGDSNKPNQPDGGPGPRPPGGMRPPGG